jgi:UDP-N-acetylglucosamine 2-epimerase (non-hydrolysing)
MKIATVLGTRPEIIKLSPLIPLLDKEFDHILIHTGQHYSYNMDKIFFEDLNLRDCDYVLNIGSGSHGKQTGKMIMGIEDVLIKEEPDVVLVQGDTNSTLAGAITASKLQMKVAHVEAGCRSFDRQMPEEINRTLVDHVSNILFAPDGNAYKNLTAEGISDSLIHLVGNTSVDACLRAINLFNLDKLEDFGLKKSDYVLLTIHRQENTTHLKLKEILGAINVISERIKVVFPVHLRTKKIIVENGIKLNENIILTDPLGYKDFMGLLSNSKFVLTDSGGIQEESVILNIPCLILRENTEWMSYVNMGKNVLLGTDKIKVISFLNDLLDDEQHLKIMQKIKIHIKNGASIKILDVLKKL